MADIASLIDGNAANIKLSSEYLNHLKKLASDFADDHLIDVVTKFKALQTEFCNFSSHVIDREADVIDTAKLDAAVRQSSDFVNFLSTNLAEFISDYAVTVSKAKERERLSKKMDALKGSLKNDVKDF